MANHLAVHLGNHIVQDRQQAVGGKDRVHILCVGFDEILLVLGILEQPDRNGGAEVVAVAVSRGSDELLDHVPMVGRAEAGPVQVEEDPPPLARAVLRAVESDVARVGIAEEGLHDPVVGPLLNVDLGGDVVKMLLHRQIVGADVGQQSVVCVEAAGLDGLVALDHIQIVLFDALTVVDVGLVDFVADVVHSPVFTVHVNRNGVIVHQIQIHLPRDHAGTVGVDDIGIDSVLTARAEEQIVKYRHTVLAEEGIIGGARAEDLLQIDGDRFLLHHAGILTVILDAGGKADAQRAVLFVILEKDLPLPVFPVVCALVGVRCGPAGTVCPDAPLVTEQVVRVAGQADHVQIVLVLHQEGAGYAFRVDLAVHRDDGTDDCGFGQLQRSLVDRTVCGRLGAVQRVADDAAPLCGGDGHRVAVGNENACRGFKYGRLCIGGSRALCRVGLALGGRGIKHAGEHAVFHRSARADARPLQAGFEGVGDHTLGVYQIDGAAGMADLEARIQAFDLVGGGAACVHDQIAVRGDGHVGKGIVAQVAHRFAQGPACQIHRLVGVVVQLDPVLVGNAVLGVGADRADLVYVDLLQGCNGKRLQRVQTVCGILLAGGRTGEEFPAARLGGISAVRGRFGKCHGGDPIDRDALVA